MADSLIQQTSFPDLEGWEDTEQKKMDAARSVAALNEYRRSQRKEAEQERDRKVARQRAEEIQEEIRLRTQDLQKLSDRLTKLSRQLGTQQAGYDFQKWFYDLADYFEVISRRPYVSNGRQIDGSITVDGTTYLVELKFTREQSDSPDIDSLHKKVTSKADNTMGIMISISGYSSTAINEASGPKTPLLLLDHNHIFWLLSGSITLEELVSRTRRHSSQTGEAYLPTVAFSA
jgi:phage-related protein